MFDTAASFGWITIAFHWLAAIGYFALFGIGAYMVTLDYYDPLSVKLPFWHKGLGVLLMFVVFLRLGWRLFNDRPEPPTGHKTWELLGATLAHWSMNAGFLIVLISGYLISTSAGAGINVIDLFTLPSLGLDLPNQEDTAGIVHQYSAYAILAIAALHALAALKHHFIDKDDTLKRMLMPETKENT